MKRVSYIVLGHSRDEKGKLMNLHPLAVAHCVHTWMGGAVTTAMKVVEIYDI